MEWKVETAKFIELHSASSGTLLAVNPVGIAAFGLRKDPNGAESGCWLTLIGSPEDLVVSESYDTIKAVMGMAR